MKPTRAPSKQDRKEGRRKVQRISVGRANAGLTHIAGEMFVAAELAKMGYSVSLTMGNAKAVDLFAERDGHSICIQVKAIAKKQNVGWPLPFDRAKIVAGVMYVCVVLNEKDVPPTYYVLPPEEVLRQGKWYATRAILNIGDASQFEGEWGLIDDALRKLDRTARRLRRCNA